MKPSDAMIVEYTLGRLPWEEAEIVEDAYQEHKEVRCLVRLMLKQAGRERELQYLDNPRFLPLPCKTYPFSLTTARTISSRDYTSVMQTLDPLLVSRTKRRAARNCEAAIGGELGAAIGSTVFFDDLVATFADDLAEMTGDAVLLWHLFAAQRLGIECCRRVYEELHLLSLRRTETGVVNIAQSEQTASIPCGPIRNAGDLRVWCSSPRVATNRLTRLVLLIDEADLEIARVALLACFGLNEKFIASLLKVDETEASFVANWVVSAICDDDAKRAKVPQWPGGKHPPRILFD